MLRYLRCCALGRNHKRSRARSIRCLTAKLVFSYIEPAPNAPERASPFVAQQPALACPHDARRPDLPRADAAGRRTNAEVACRAETGLGPAAEIMYLLHHTRG